MAQVIWISKFQAGILLADFEQKTQESLTRNYQVILKIVSLAQRVLIPLIIAKA